MADEPLHLRWTEVRDEARRLIEQKPWLDQPDWAAGRVVHDPRSGGFLSDLMIAICLLIAISMIPLAVSYRTWEPLAFTGLFLTPAGLLIYFRLKARYGKSECFLRSIPARVGGTFEADVKVRLRARPDAQIRASLANAFPDTGRRSVWQGIGPDEVRIATDGVWTAGRRVWSAEQWIGRGEIRIATDGTWTIPVRISIPPAVRAEELGPVWLLDVHVETAGPDYSAQFPVPVFDLADLPYDEDMAQRQLAAAYATPRFRGFDAAVGILVGAITGFGVGFEFGEIVPRGGRMGGPLIGLFLAPFFAAACAFLALGAWRGAIAVALRDRDLPERGVEMRLRLMLLTLAPWTVAAIVLWFAWKVLPLAGFAWGIGMLLCAHPSPFGRVWRDPLFQSGAALTLCTLAGRI